MVRNLWLLALLVILLRPQPCAPKNSKQASKDFNSKIAEVRTKLLLGPFHSHHNHGACKIPLMFKFRRVISIYMYVTIDF